MQLKLTVDAKRAMSVVKNLGSSIRKAEVLALNSIAFKIMTAEREAIAATFAHPRPFTIANNFYAQATLQEPTAIIGLKPRANVYLSPYEFGGKHFVPQRVGLKDDLLLVPVGIKVDRYGQIPSGAALSAIMNRPDVFVGEVFGVMGVWQRPVRNAQPPDVRKGRRKGRGKAAHEGTAPKLLLRLVPNKEVSKHLKWVDRGQAIFKATFPREFEFALKRIQDAASKKG